MNTHCWVDWEDTTTSVHSFSFLKRPRKEYHEYKAGDRVMAIFRNFGECWGMIVDVSADKKDLDNQLKSRQTPIVQVISGPAVISTSKRKAAQMTESADVSGNGKSKTVRNVKSRCSVNELSDNESDNSTAYSIQELKMDAATAAKQEILRLRNHQKATDQTPATPYQPTTPHQLSSTTSTTSSTPYQPTSTTLSTPHQTSSTTDQPAATPYTYQTPTTPLQPPNIPTTRLQHTPSHSTHQVTTHTSPQHQVLDTHIITPHTISQYTPPTNNTYHSLLAPYYSNYTHSDTQNLSDIMCAANDVLFDRDASTTRSSACHSCCARVDRLERELDEMKKEMEKLKRRKKTSGQQNESVAEPTTSCTYNGKTKEELQEIIRFTSLTTAVKTILEALFSMEELTTRTLTGQRSHKDCRPKMALDAQRKLLMEELLYQKFGEGTPLSGIRTKIRDRLKLFRRSHVF